MGINRRMEIAGTLTATIYWFVSEMLTPILSLYASSKGFKPFEVSIILAAQTFLPFLFTIQIGVLADRFGQVAVLTFGWSAMLLGGLMLLWNQNFVMLVFIQTLIGVGHLAVWLSSQSIVTYVGEGQRDKAISRMSFFTAIGQLFGPLFGGWILDHYSFQYVFGFYSSIAFLLIMSYPLVKKSVTQVPDRSIRINFISAYVHGGKLYKHNKGVRVATFISFNLAFILFIRVSYLPIYLESKHYSATNIGFLVGLWSFASIFVRPITSFLMHYAGRFWTTNIALLTSVGGLVCLTVASSWPGMIATLVILGIGTGLNQPLAISLVSQYTSSVNRGLGMGIRLMANRMANWISPLTIGSISYYTGLAKAFSIAAIPLSFISGFAIYHLFHLFQRNSNTNEQGVEGHEFRKHT